MEEEAVKNRIRNKKLENDKKNLINTNKHIINSNILNNNNNNQGGVGVGGSVSGGIGSNINNNNALQTIDKLMFENENLKSKNTELQTSLNTFANSRSSRSSSLTFNGTLLKINTIHKTSNFKKKKYFCVFFLFAFFFGCVILGDVLRFCVKCFF